MNVAAHHLAARPGKLVLRPASIPSLQSTVASNSQDPKRLPNGVSGFKNPVVSCHGRPKALEYAVFAQFWDHFGSILEPFWVILDHPGTILGGLVDVEGK